MDLCKEMAEAATNMEIIQATFIIGIEGTIMEKQWIENLKMLNIEEEEMEQVITDCIIQKLEAQHMLWMARKKEGNQEDQGKHGQGKLAHDGAKGHDFGMRQRKGTVEMKQERLQEQRK
eukprot:751347-Hanusia_phi.AAC.13